MNNTLTARPAYSVTALLTALRVQRARLMAALTVLVLGFAQYAAAQTAPGGGTTGAGSPDGLVQELDKGAGTFCGYVKVLPKSKWVKAGALVLFLLGMVLLIFGGRGGTSWLMRALGAVILIPSAIAIAGAFGMIC